MRTTPTRTPLLACLALLLVAQGWAGEDATTPRPPEAPVAVQVVTPTLIAQIAFTQKLDGKVTLDYQDVDFVDVIDFIMRITGINIVLDPAVMKQVPAPITLKVQAMRIGDVLDLIERRSGLEHLVKDGAYVIRPAGPQAPVQAEHRVDLPHTDQLPELADTVVSQDQNEAAAGPADGEYAGRQVGYGASGNCVLTYHQGRLKSPAHGVTNVAKKLRAIHLGGLDGYAWTDSTRKPALPDGDIVFFPIGDAFIGWEFPHYKDPGSLHKCVFEAWRVGAPAPAQRLDEARRLIALRKPLDAIPMLRGIIEFARQDLNVSEPALSLLVQAFQLAKDAQGIADQYPTIVGRYLAKVPPLDGTSLPDPAALEEGLLWKSWTKGGSRFTVTLTCKAEDRRAEFKGAITTTEGNHELRSATWKDVVITTDRGIVPASSLRFREGISHIDREDTPTISFPLGQSQRITKFQGTLILKQVGRTKIQTLPAEVGKTWEQTQTDGAKRLAQVLSVQGDKDNWSLIVCQAFNSFDRSIRVLDATGVDIEEYGHTGGGNSEDYIKNFHLTKKPVTIEVVSAIEISEHAVHLDLTDVPIK